MSWCIPTLQPTFLHNAACKQYYTSMYIHIATLIFALILQIETRFLGPNFKKVTYFISMTNNTKVHFVALTQKHTRILSSMNDIHRSCSFH